MSVTHPTPIAEIVRCACEDCGAHANALDSGRLVGSCPNCGSFQLVAIENAEPLAAGYAPVNLPGGPGGQRTPPPQTLAA